MKPSVYIETSVISYLAARPSRDIVVAGRQAETHDWWMKQRHRFELLASVVVLDEARRGDSDQSARRLNFLEEVLCVSVSAKAAGLAEELIQEGGVPRGCEEDSLHIAIAATQGTDFLLTWNFRHINNAEQKQRISTIVDTCGYRCPLICTPDSLGGNKDD